MKKAALISFLCVLLWSFSGGDRHQLMNYKGGYYNVSCQLLDGRYDGLYISRYLNGKKKAEGKFSNNMRTGKWTVWDSTGKVKMIREYKSNFDYQRIFPAYPDGPAKLFAAPQEKPVYNAQGFLEYPYLEERSVSYNLRIWRFIPAKNNKLLFENHRLYHLMVQASLDSAAGVWNDDEFKVKRTLSMIRHSDSLMAGDSLVGFKIKEDSFFDNKRMLSETRIIAICPVVCSRKGEKVNKDFGWFYFNQLRPLMAKEKLEEKEIPAYIHSLDDLFFYRYFYGEIYKEANFKQRLLSDYVSGKELEQEQRRIEFKIVEMEHDMWLSIAS